MTDARDVTFSLEPLTVLDSDSEAAIAIALETGCAYAGFWLHSPWPSFFAPCQVIGKPKARAVRGSLAASGVKALGLEVFELGPSADLESFLPSLELGALVGCTSATVIFADDPETQRQRDQFAALCELARPFSMRVNAEFISYRSLSTLGQAAKLVADAGQQNAGIVVDILHLIRSGGTVADVAALDPRLIGHAQLSDGAAQIAAEDRRFEASDNRLVPGDGTFPLQDFVRALPPGPLGLEVPAASPAFKGLSPLERVQHLVKRTRDVLAV